MSVMSVVSKDFDREKRINYYQREYHNDGFQICKFRTKFTEKFIRAYKKSTTRDLTHVYNHYSIKKEIAFEECLDIRYKYDSYRNSGKIISYNINFFTYAFIGEYVSENSEGLALFVITSSYRYIIPLYGEGLV